MMRPAEGRLRPGGAGTVNETPARPARRLLRAGLWASPALTAYAVLLPLAARALDRGLGLAALPPWGAWPGVALLLAGLAVAAWTLWLFAIVGRGSPNPIAPPERLVTQGPYRFSRNPMMLGGWMAGIGLALLLRSPSLLVAVAAIVLLGAGYVRVVEEPALRRRFGDAYREYERAVPRWWCALAAARRSMRS